MKLYRKFIIAYLALCVAGFVLIATLSTSLTHQYLIQTRSETLYDEAMLIANTYSAVYDGQDMDLSGIEPQIDGVATFLSAQIWIVDKEGNIIVDSSNERTGYIIQNFDPTATGNKSYMTGDFFGTFDEEMLSVSAPITGNYKIYGYVVIHLPMSNVDVNQNKILNIIYTTVAIIYGLSFMMLVLFHFLVYRPLKKLNAGTKEIADGKYNTRIDINSDDEMKELAGSINYIAQEMDKAEEYQHKFIANVSHDFRSPLTSIKGYLEAILDGTIAQEKQPMYIERVIAETERLTKLTNSMLTVNTLDAASYINRDNFDINRVIRDTAQSFEMQCNAKNITFEMTFEGETQMVYADYSKIQQVLYNLIDNAIKFSKQNSVIYCATTTNHDKVYVSVKDTGAGIPKSDIKKVFDRFYKSDSSRGRDKKGTGLGLSIVKEIIQGHGENIDVISTEGVGTEFIFSLPIPEEFLED